MQKTGAWVEPRLLSYSFVHLFHHSFIQQNLCMKDASKSQTGHSSEGSKSNATNFNVNVIMEGNQ